MERRHFLAALPALALAPRLAAQSAPASLKVRGLSQLTLTVSDVSRSLKFYQDLFGMPIQARQGTTLFLRIGSGPQFLALKQAAAGERPSISAFGMGVEDFSVDRVLRVLEQNGVTRATGDAGAPRWTVTTARRCSGLQRSQAAPQVWTEPNTCLLVTTRSSAPCIRRR